MTNIKLKPILIMKLFATMKLIESTKFRKFKYQNWGKNQLNSKYETNCRIQQWNPSLNEINEAFKEWKNKLKKRVRIIPWIVEIAPKLKNKKIEELSSN